MTTEHQYSLGFLAEEIRDLVDDGVECPTCTQFAKVYKRHINSGMARSLIKMYLADPSCREWIHVPTVVGGRSREEGKLRYWGLVEDSGERRDDGGKAGFWRITARGALFVEDQLSVPNTAHVYNGECLQLSGARLYIHDAIGHKFSYNELMGNQGTLF